VSYDHKNAPTDPWMETFTGRTFTPLHPKVEDIDIKDIARGLALQCRYAGHCHHFYSVAEHSVRVSWLLPPETALCGLLHDAAEAYVSDMIRPLKVSKELGEPYLQIEERLMGAIAERFELPWPLPQAVKDADNILLFTEKRDIKKSPLKWVGEDNFTPLSEVIVPWSWQYAEEQFLYEFGYLQAARKELTVGRN
jgi:5'-deoxynucleotidase YfbR-like HD superfamily hydrolase